MRRLGIFVGIALAAAGHATCLAASAPEACGILDSMPAGGDDGRFAGIDQAIRQGLGPDGLYPGAVILIAHDGHVAHLAAFGNAQDLVVGKDGRVAPLAPPRPMRTDEIFDMASVSKMEATTAAILHLVDQNRLHLDDRLGRLLPVFAGTDKAAITVEQLLTHRAGLWEWQPTWLHRDATGSVMPFLARLPRRYGIGERWAYSDLGFMILGAIVSRVSGMPLDAYVRKELYLPQKMPDTGYLPSPALAPRIAATSQGDAYQRRMAETGKPFPIMFPPDRAGPVAYRTDFLVGQVNDANSWLGWDGVAGHAGVFSTALDLAHYLQTLLNGGCYGNWRLASPAVLARFEQTPFDAKQALGFRKIQIDGVTTPIFGHSGFTGTQFMFAPALNLSVVLLTNRLHRPDSASLHYPALTVLWNQVMRGAVTAAIQ
ncbi:serine hydrolase domain-containing protein [Gluconacetobacter sacchari]|uniref:serine hydrolase domain-containing protein n=1 Tax=Gluconacetobacter sacchari TaxID=92759 RepID=UPI0039B3FD38